MPKQVPIDRWRRKVKRLHRQGFSPEKIASELGCNVKLVRTQIECWEKEKRGAK